MEPIFIGALTTEQDATRARGPLGRFAADHGLSIAARYTENQSGAKLARPELFHFTDCRPFEMLLVEVDRLSSLTGPDCRTANHAVEVSEPNDCFAAGLKVGGTSVMGAEPNVRKLATHQR